METTKEQLANFAIDLIKEVLESENNIGVEIKKDSIVVWLYIYKNDEVYSFDSNHIFLCDDLETNKDKFEKAILKIRGK